MKSFSGKVAAITGAGSGIGRALALELARRGCELALSDVDEAGLAETAAAISRVRVTTKRVDVADREALRGWAREVMSDFGRVNLVFNNAGISYGATVEGIPLAEFERVMAIDFWGVVHGTQAFLPYLRASGEGHIVNISSLFGLLAFPGQCAYNSAKFAVRGFTEALRIELEMTGAPVSATSVHPGGIKTNIARASKMHASLADLGINLKHAQRDFEKSFRVTPEEAATIILRGVEKNARRVLVGTDAKILDLVQRIVPAHYAGVLAKASRYVMGRRASRRAKAATSVEKPLEAQN